MVVLASLTRASWLSVWIWLLLVCRGITGAQQWPLRGHSRESFSSALGRNGSTSVRTIGQNESDVIIPRQWPWSAVCGAVSASLHLPLCTQECLCVWLRCTRTLQPCDSEWVNHHFAMDLSHFLEMWLYTSTRGNQCKPGPVFPAGFPLAPLVFTGPCKPNSKMPVMIADVTREMSSCEFWQYRWCRWSPKTQSQSLNETMTK